MTILGTRPEIIRLSLTIKVLDQHATHILVDTGQNYDDRLSALFFRELEVRRPDVSLCVRGAGFGDQVGQILARSEKALREHEPDRLVILGDTNSGLAAIVARDEWEFPCITWRLVTAVTISGYLRKATGESLIT
ncbi:MAG: UDP-N-acetylglucosamine 2-epimerase [Candidatus Acidiferrales bacterium]